MAAVCAAAAAAGIAVAAAAAGAATAAGAARFLAFTWDGVRIEARPELATSCPLRACSVGRDEYWCSFYAAVTGDSDEHLHVAGWCQLGAEQDRAQRVLASMEPPLSGISSVGCGLAFAVALHRCGALSSWGCPEAMALGRGGPASRPAVVAGVPPVALLGVGTCFAIALTRDDKAYAWGKNSSAQLCLGRAGGFEPVPRRAERLCGLGLRRIACGGSCAVAETVGELVWWGTVAREEQFRPKRVPWEGPVSLPLRGLVLIELVECTAVAVDADGAVWCCRLRSGMRRAPLGRRALCIAAGHYAAVALTEHGLLYDIRLVGNEASCRCINLLHPELPLGLVPHGGAGSFEVALIHDHCCGKERLRLFARIAARVGVPSDWVRVTLTPLMVGAVHLTGTAADPFGWL
eukprot:TRINITY_DN3328_c3_g1_i1.p1 TRINITY_DN3328_c3_g1~~TRINITY_DN3328_c3_g1_i1.p1  ORF type:complete len:406 (+),score=50.28 TRINITY_DN3328_c3_g1_i1:82-1299(+)